MAMAAVAPGRCVASEACTSAVGLVGIHVNDLQLSRLSHESYHLALMLVGIHYQRQHAAQASTTIGDSGRGQGATTHCGGQRGIPSELPQQLIPTICIDAPCQDLARRITTDEEPSVDY